MTPVGKGQRGLIVAPPRTGKTTLLQHIAAAVVKNYPEMKLIILLVDERPEEVTEIRRTVPTAEIMASSNDSDMKTPHPHRRNSPSSARKRLVEMGKDVFMLMDSLTRIGPRVQQRPGRRRPHHERRHGFPRAGNPAQTFRRGPQHRGSRLAHHHGHRPDRDEQPHGRADLPGVQGHRQHGARPRPQDQPISASTRPSIFSTPAPAARNCSCPPDDLHKINVIRRGLAGHKPIEAIERLLMLRPQVPEQRPNAARDSRLNR